jgi:integrase
MRTRLREISCAAPRRSAFRFHDLRGSHETLLLDKGIPVHVVAAHCGHDPAMLLRTYAKRTKKADTSAAEIIGALSKGFSEVKSGNEGSNKHGKAGGPSIS